MSAVRFDKRHKEWCLSNLTILNVLLAAKNHLLGVVVHEQIWLGLAVVALHFEIRNTGRGHRFFAATACCYVSEGCKEPSLASLLLFRCFRGMKLVS